MQRKISNNEFRQIFDSIAPVYDKIINKYAVDRRKEFFINHAQGKCLEVGAGSGIIAKALNKKHQIIATDASPQMVKVLKSKGLKAIICDAERLPFPSRSFDTIIASEMIYYLDNPGNFIKECRRVLKGDGILLISSANSFSKYYDIFRSILRFFGFKNIYFDDKNREFMSVERLKKLLYKGSFRNIYLEQTIILPIPQFDTINRVLEKSIFNKLSTFIFIKAKKF